jgi:hypothetical protein
MTTVSRRGSAARWRRGAWRRCLRPLRGAATRKRQVGVIGCGWYGMVNVQAAFKAGPSTSWRCAMSTGASADCGRRGCQT